MKYMKVLKKLWFCNVRAFFLSDSLTIKLMVEHQTGFERSEASIRTAAEQLLEQTLKTEQVSSQLSSSLGISKYDPAHMAGISGEQDRVMDNFLNDIYHYNNKAHYHRCRLLVLMRRKGRCWAEACIILNDNSVEDSLISVIDAYENKEIEEGVAIQAIEAAKNCVRSRDLSKYSLNGK